MVHDAVERLLFGLFLLPLLHDMMVVGGRDASWGRRGGSDADRCVPVRRAALLRHQNRWGGMAARSMALVKS